MDAREQRRAKREVVAQLRAEREAQGRNRKHITRFRRFRRRIGTVLVELCAPQILRLIARTWRVQRTGTPGQELQASESPWIFTMWHGRMLTLMPLKRHCHRGIGVLVSPSDDGGLAKRALVKFGYQVVRGSLSRGGANAMREMRALLEKGGQLVITPDGPRGPRHSINIGPAWLARATGTRILPVGVAMDRAWRFNSWDRMTMPKPFARVIVHYGDPIEVPKQTDDAALEALSAKVREHMIAAERAAFGQLQVGCDFDDEPAQC